MPTRPTTPWQRAAAVAVSLLMAVAGFAVTAHAHGSLESPVSRIYGCYLEGPERPSTPACQAAVAAGGSQPLYDWNEVNQGQANGNHRGLIPDGQLCSGGRAKYAAFDQPRVDWPTTRLTAGADFTFAFGGTAPHGGGFEFYITRGGYDASKPLRWDDLEPAPFLEAYNPPLVNGNYIMQTRLPTAKEGRHLIYVIWQRSDSPEAFYSCSDVVFDSGSTLAPSLVPVPRPVPEPPLETPVVPEPEPPVTEPAPAPVPTPAMEPVEVAEWTNGTRYETGALVTYGDITYACRQAHTSQMDWTPPETLALWLPLAPPHHE